MNDIIRDDGYVSVTALCRKGNKKPNDWLRLKQTKNLVEICSKHINIDSDKLIEVYIGGNKSGTWIHPLLATNLAQWISNDFAIKVSLWIEEWKQINGNKTLYNKEISNIKPDFNFQKEKEIQLKLQKELGGKIEVETDTGFIDLLTDNEIIEIKNGKNWKEAVGQILIYSLEFPLHKKRIHLFDIENDITINNKCRIYNINVTYE